MILKCIRSKVRERSESKPVVYCFCFASLFAKDKICFVTLHFKNAHPKINLGEKLIWIRNITSFLTLYLWLFTHSKICISWPLFTGPQGIAPSLLICRHKSWLPQESSFPLILQGLIDLLWNVSHSETKKSVH